MRQVKNDIDQSAQQAFRTDAENLRRQLQKEEEDSLLKADKKDYPKDKEGNNISNEKISEFIKPIAGRGNKDKKPINVINRLTNTYGGQPSDWSKDSTNKKKLSKGSPRTQESHSYKNQRTGETVEIKQKFPIQDRFDENKIFVKSLDMMLKERDLDIKKSMAKGKSRSDATIHADKNLFNKLTGEQINDNKDKKVSREELQNKVKEGMKKNFGDEGIKRYEEKLAEERKRQEELQKQFKANLDNTYSQKR